MSKKEGNKDSSTESSKIDFVKWFSELDKTSGNVAGGKGANLAEIYNLKVPVPAGFVVTAQAYSYFIKKAGIKEKIEKILSGIEYENTNELDKRTKEIRELIMKSSFPKEIETEILEAYENLGNEKLESDLKSVSEFLDNSLEPSFVAVRSSATTEDLAEASFAGQQDSFMNVKGNKELIEHIKKCFASLFTSRATYYRNKKGFIHSDAKLAVVVQKMIDSDKSGVIFSRDPSYKKEGVIIEAVWGLGEGIVSGQITPDTYRVGDDYNIIDKKISTKRTAITRDSGGNQIIVNLKEERANMQVLEDNEIRELAQIARKLEEHYGKPQDIEFAIENKEIFIVQTRPITTIEKSFDSSEGKNIKGEVVLTGLGASPGIASGKIKIVHNLAELDKVKKGDILVTKMTNPDMVVTMQRSAAIVTDEGGLTAHAAIVSREMGIPAIVGTGSATTKLKEGEIITVDGQSGKIYKGKTSENILQDINPVTTKTKTEIKIMLDLPSFAGRAAKTKIRSIGLTRMEGIIAESGKHPNYFLKSNKISEYENIIFKGISGIANFFDEIWVRTSDIRSDEFRNLEDSPKEIEANPMLGMHGIRFGLKYPEILLAELKALKKVSDAGKKIGVMMPQIISVDELKAVKKMLNQIGFSKAKVGIMVETPAAVQLIKDFCEEGINFISFGTNDLTQYMLAVDRGNTAVQGLYNEMHPAILYQLAYVIRTCKRSNVETSICGQAGSKKEMVKFLVEQGISSISVNADVADSISKYVAEIEAELVKGTDKEPRKYSAEKSENQNHSEKNKNTKNNELPQIRGIEKIKLPENKEIEKDIEAIEAEKREYLKKHPEEQEE